jgi:hypothetical protein
VVASITELNLEFSVTSCTFLIHYHSWKTSLLIILNNLTRAVKRKSDVVRIKCISVESGTILD